MSFSYVAPAQLAWARMVRMLFRPFRFGTWAVLGFAAFLSEYLSSSGGGKSGISGRDSDPNWGDGPGFGAVLREIAGFLLHPVWGPVAIAVAFGILTLVLVVMWVSCRGKFIFLDNVVHERTGIVEPWRRFASHGNSLFVFKWILTMVVVAVALAISLPLLPAILGAIQSGPDWRLLLGALALWWIVAMMPLILVASLAFLFLDQFVVPIMYRDGAGVLAAWRRFFALFGAHAGPVLGYAILYLVAIAGIAAGMVAVGFATCCVGFVLVSVPYVGSVVTLPVEVILRGVGPDFLAQFGPEWSVFSSSPESRPAPPAAGTGA